MTTPPTVFYSSSRFCVLVTGSTLSFLFSLLIPEGQIHLFACLLSRKVKPQGRLHNCSPGAGGLQYLPQGHFAKKTKMFRPKTKPLCTVLQYLQYLLFYFALKVILTAKLWHIHKIIKKIMSTETVLTYTGCLTFRHQINEGIFSFS